MTYLLLVTSHIRRNGGGDVLVSVVEDYLRNAHPRDKPPWSVEFDDICSAAVAYANAKQHRLRKHKRAASAKHAKLPWAKS